MQPAVPYTSFHITIDLYSPGPRFLKTLADMQELTLKRLAAQRVFGVVTWADPFGIRCGFRGKQLNFRGVFVFFPFNYHLAGGFLTFFNFHPWRTGIQFELQMPFSRFSWARYIVCCWVTVRSPDGWTKILGKERSPKMISSTLQVGDQM